jgi:Ca2+:H+ antiporter
MVLDIFEVVMLLGACFLINYITADAKTNWVEGYTLVSFYIIIVSALWLIEASPSY